MTPRYALLAALCFGLAGCASRTPVAPPASAPAPSAQRLNASDARVGLRAGLFDAQEAMWNMRVVSATPPPESFVGSWNSDLAFQGNLAYQGNFDGVIVWDMSNPAEPQLVTEYVCPASQSDVSIYENLLFVSGEGLEGRLDCGTQGVDAAASPERLRGIRIFDVSDPANPQYVSNVQTCRGSHTHSIMPDATGENVYVYVSGSAPVRPEEELPGCVSAMPEDDSETALFRIEVIKVPVADPTQAAIVSSPRIFEDLAAPPERLSMSPADRAALDRARAEGQFVAYFFGQERIIPARIIEPMLAGIVEARGGSGAPTAADSAALRARLPEMLAERFGPAEGESGEIARGPDQCHDITLYPEIGLAGGACEGYGLLLDISDPERPRRVDAVADSNFAYWHSATFNNDGTKVLFTDEWGGGTQPKCRAGDPYEWGANAIFALDGQDMDFRSYYKLPAPQTDAENCVAHNGSLVPVPGRDIMAQSWYQGGISVFDWTDADNAFEIAYHDRGPIGERLQTGGSWSVYWYNGVLVSSEIARGLDIFELTPSEHLSANEIEASKTVRLERLNAQGQPRYTWPPSFALARAYVDQLERSGGLTQAEIAAARTSLGEAEAADMAGRRTVLSALQQRMQSAAAGSSDAAKVRMLADAVRDLAG
jgi:hypothetical protein